MPLQPTLTQVTAVLRDLSGRPDLNPTLSSQLEADLGLGSLERVELRLRLERDLGIAIDDARLLQARTVGDLVALLGLAPPSPVEGPSSAPAAVPSGVHEASAARSLPDILRLQAHDRPHVRAITFLRSGEPDRPVSYQTLLETSLRAAGGLIARGVSPGDRVGLMLPTGLPFVATFFGAMLAGAIPVPLYPPVRPDRIQAFVERQATILAQAGVRLLVSFSVIRRLDGWLQASAGALDEVVSADDLLAASPPSTPVPTPDTAFLQYTSGSTGAPRGAVLTHANLLANLHAFGSALPLQPDDVVVSWLPLYHDMGLIGMLLGSLYYGRPLALMGPEDFLGRPVRWLRALHEHRGSISAAPNFAYDLCARKIADAELSGLDLTPWRVAINGAEPVRPDTMAGFEERFSVYGYSATTMRPAYGLAEATLAVSISRPGQPPRIDHVDRDRLHQEGRAIPGGTFPVVSSGPSVEGVEVRIVDPHGQVLGERTEGRLEFRGASTFQGYYGHAPARDWVDSGDLAYLADGEVFPTGRRRAMVLVAGRNVHCEDVERAAATVDGVRAGCVAAFGEDREATQDLVVVAETRHRDAAGRRRIEVEVGQAVRNAVGVGPARVVLVVPGSIPKTPSGKIRRSACQELLAAGTLGRRIGIPAQLLRLLVQRPGFWARRAARPLYGVWTGGCVALYGLGLLLAASVGQAGAWSGSLSRGLLRMVGLQLEVEGLTGVTGPILLVPNHASVLDPIVLMAAWPGPLRFVSAAWIADHPIIGPYLRWLGGIRIRRGDAAQVQPMAEALRQGAALVAFAEGGLEASPGLRPFMRGPFQAACQEGVALLPVAVRGTRRALPWGDRIPEPGRVQVIFGPLVVPTGATWDEVTATSRAVRTHVASACGEPEVAQRLVRED